MYSRNIPQQNFIELMSSDFFNKIMSYYYTKDLSFLESINIRKINTSKWDKACEHLYNKIETHAVFDVKRSSSVRSKKSFTKKTYTRKAYIEIGAFFTICGSIIIYLECTKKSIKPFSKQSITRFKKK